MRKNLPHSGSVRSARLAALLILLCFSSNLDAAVVCSRLSLKQAQPLWISSTAFLDSLGKIAIVDPLRNNLLLVSPEDGESVPYGGAELGISSNEMVPAIVNPTSEGFDLAMVDRRTFSFDRDLKVVNIQDLVKASASPGGTILGVYDSVLTGDHFFSVGAFRNSAGKFRLGFFRGSRSDPAKLQILGDIPSASYYILGHQYLASMGGNDYAVLMSEHPVILEYARNGRKRVLDVIPEKPYNVPKLKTVPTGPRSDEPMYREIEGLSIPVGLYAQDGLLYLLTRKPGQGRGTIWQLLQIDPRRGKVIGSPMLLPTIANHLTIAESAKEWFVFEKGAVQPAGNQQITTVLVIPSSGIKSRSIPGACQSQQ